MIIRLCFSSLVAVLSLWILLASCLVSSCHASTHASQQAAPDDHVLHHRRLSDKDFSSESSLFRLHPDVQAVGPTKFPKPTDYFRRPHTASAATSTIANNTDNIDIYLKPLFGTHRPNYDAVLALAAEYTLDSYLVLVESLRRTGFDGDIVLSVSALDIAKTEIRDYLESDAHVIVYVPELQCYNFEGQAVDSVKGGMRVCNLPNLYGQVIVRGESESESANGTATMTPLPDPRPARTVSVTRYEIYWIMARHYHPRQWLLLIDSRDSYFQLNPFTNVPRQPSSPLSSGLLYFFGENANATRIGASNMNRKWLTLAYGQATANALQNYPIVCSGATMGEQVAVDAYLRAMVAESDETGTLIYGADQGFHNYLYYSGKLRNAEAIHGIVVFAQGDGIVNNLGAMRTKPLSEWGNGKILGEIDNVDKPGEAMAHVLNWDGSPSPVVHQYDRHDILTLHFYKRKRVHFRNAYSERRSKSVAK